MAVLDHAARPSIFEVAIYLWLFCGGATIATYLLELWLVTRQRSLLLSSCLFGTSVLTIYTLILIIYAGLSA